MQWVKWFNENDSKTAVSACLCRLVATEQLNYCLVIT